MEEAAVRYDDVSMDSFGRYDKPNEQTISAFEEMDVIKANPHLAKTYGSFGALLLDVKQRMARGEL